MKQQKIEQPQQVPPSYMVQQPWYPPEDEISLLDLWRVLVKQKQVIAGVTAIAVVVALLYALSVAPVYQAETHFLPPQAKEIQSLNVQGVQGVQGVSVDAVYSAYQRNLGSSRLQRQYFEQEGIRQLVEVDEASGNSDEQVFESFSRQLKINSSKKNKSALSLSVEWGDAETAARIANEYSALVDRETVKEFASNLRNAVSNRVRDIEYTIASKRKMAKQRREDRIAVLSEAIKVAATLGIVDRVEGDSISVMQQATPSATVVADLASAPLYYRGERALQAEIAVLKARSSDDPFISGLRDLQEELTRLQSVKIDESGLHAATIDRKAYAPEHRIKPKRKLIVVLGMVLGFMLGVFLAFFRNFLDNQRKEVEDDAKVISENL